jgi:hypothetical protein
LRRYFQSKIYSSNLLIFRKILSHIFPHGGTHVKTQYIALWWSIFLNLAIYPAFVTSCATQSLDLWRNRYDYKYIHGCWLKKDVLVSQLAWQILFKYLTELALLRPSNYFTINRIKNATNAVCRHTIHVTLIRSNLHDFYTFSQIHVLFAESWCNLFELFGQTCDKIVCYQYSASFYIPLGFDTGLIVAWWLILEVRVLLFTLLINMYRAGDLGLMLFYLCGFYLSLHCAFLLVFWIDWFFGVLTPLSAIFQLYHGDQF